jgi:hypothetical protein
MQSLADDPFDQARASSLLNEAAKAASTRASVGASLDIWLAYRGKPYCDPPQLANLHLGCSAGLAAACSDLFREDGGCMRAAFETWQGSFGAPTWSAGSFAFTTRELVLPGLGSVQRGTKVVVLGSKLDSIAALLLDRRFTTDGRSALLRVPPAALDTHHVEAWAPRPTGTVVHAFSRRVFDVPRPPLDSSSSFDDETSWIASGCDAIEILEERVIEGHTLQRIRQAHQGVVLDGWIRHPIERSWGPAVCQRRSMITEHGEEPPYGYTSAFEAIDQPRVKAAIQKWMKSTGTITMIEFEDATGPSCVTKRWQRGVLRGAWSEWYVPGGGAEGGPTIRSRSYESFRAADMTLAIVSSPEHSNGTRTHLRCGADVWQVVRATEQAFEVMPLGNTLVQSSERIHAFHPEDVTRWWLQPEACERALAERPNYSLAELRQRAEVPQITSIVIGVPGC